MTSQPESTEEKPYDENEVNEQKEKEPNNGITSSTLISASPKIVQQVNRSEADKKLVYIAGDSIIQHIQGWNLSTSDRHVAVKSFSGARIEDMEDYIKPLLRKEPEEIIYTSELTTFAMNRYCKSCH